MRDNGRAPIVASKLPPNLLMLYPDAGPVVACPGCGRWRVPRISSARRVTVRAVLCPYPLTS